MTKHYDQKGNSLFGFLFQITVYHQRNKERNSNMTGNWNQAIAEAMDRVPLSGLLSMAFFFLLGIFLIYISNAIPIVPHTLTLTPLPPPPTPTFWPWRSPVMGHIKFESPMGLSLQ
jgi:choline-glycine betaine transporter